MCSEGSQQRAPSPCPKVLSHLLAVELGSSTKDLLVLTKALSPDQRKHFCRTTPWPEQPARTSDRKKAPWMNTCPPEVSLLELSLPVHVLLGLQGSRAPESVLRGQEISGLLGEWMVDTEEEKESLNPCSSLLLHCYYL